MLDIWTVLTLAAAFAVVTGFVIWCGRTVEETGGERE